MSKVEAAEHILERLCLTEQEKWKLAQWLQHERLHQWGKRLDALYQRVEQRQKELPRLTMRDIVAEVKAVRRARASRRRA